MQLDWSITVAILGAIGGGVGVYVLKVLVPTQKDRMDANQHIRENLIRIEGELRDKIRETQNELDEWKTHYYELLKDYHEIKNSFEALQKDYDNLKGKYDNLKKQVDKMKNS